MGAGAARTRGVLICDDLDAIRDLLRLIIDDAPTMHVVGEAADGRAAISEAARLQPDVILLDLAMPVMTGLEALPELRRIVPAAVIIVLSGFASTVAGSELRALGADAYIEKGSSIVAIVDTIARLAAEAALAG